MVKKIAGTVEKTFHMMDENQDGELDKSELREALRKLGVHRDLLDKDVKTLMEAADTNDDGVISLHEFKNWYLREKIRAGRRIEKLFHVFDEDRDGFISKEECKSLLAAVNGCEPPIDMINTVMKRSDSALFINLDNVIAWFDSENPSETEISSNKRVSISKATVIPASCKVQCSKKKVSIPKTTVVPASCKVQSDLEQSEVGVDGLVIAVDSEDDSLSISFPFGEGWKCKLQWALTIPLVFPLWCTLFDVRQKMYQKYYGLTFIGSIMWLGIFSFLMVWWATVVA